MLSLKSTRSQQNDDKEVAATLAAVAKVTEVNVLERIDSAVAKRSLQMRCAPRELGD